MFSKTLCHFPVFFHEIPEVRDVCFLASADIIISVMIPIINSIKCN